MRHGIFVTGTDTGVGKTVVSAAVMIRYRPLGSLRYWKPIQTGVEKDNDTFEVRHLAELREMETLDAGVRLPRPVSPHLAARWAGETIRIQALTELLDLRDPTERWIVEGAGGVLVPVNDTELMIDLICALELPVLVVARSSLGTINHTLTTLEALRSRGLSVAGIVMVGDRNHENRCAIERYGGVRVLGEMPRFDQLTAETLVRWATNDFDPDETLLEWIQ